MAKKYADMIKMINDKNNAVPGKKICKRGPAFG